MDNATCKYCGTYLDKSLHCPYCDLTFSSEEICFNSERQTQMIYEIPMIRENEHLIFELMSRSTEDLLNEKTLTLYYLLRAARKAKDIFFREKDQERFTFFTKKNFIIENILLEREGCFPLSVSDAFLRKKQEEVQKFENNLVFKNRQKMSVLKIQ